MQVDVLFRSTLYRGKESASPLKRASRVFSPGVSSSSHRIEICAISPMKCALDQGIVSVTAARKVGREPHLGCVRLKFWVRFVVDCVVRKLVELYGAVMSACF